MNKNLNEKIIVRNKKTLEDKKKLLWEIHNETCGWGTNELLMNKLCQTLTSWHLNHMDETITRLAEACDYDELVDELKRYKEENTLLKAN